MLNIYHEEYVFDSKEITAEQLIAELTQHANRYGYIIRFDVANTRKRLRTLIATITGDVDCHSDWFVNVICPMEYKGIFKNIFWDYAKK